MMQPQTISLLATGAYFLLLGQSFAAPSLTTLTGLGIETPSPPPPSNPPSSPPNGPPPAPGPKVIPIVVGSPILNQSLVFTPKNIDDPGDIVRFQFSRVNHTVTQSSFSNPCMPMQQEDPSAAGIHSGFMPVAANSTTVQIFDMSINDRTPTMYLYCAQGPHCQLGIAYQNASSRSLVNIPAERVQGGVHGTISSEGGVGCDASSHLIVVFVLEDSILRRRVPSYIIPSDIRSAM